MFDEEMQRLDAADSSRVGRFLADVGPVVDDEPFPRSFLAELRGLVSCGWTGR
jgi:hypothetical protein